MTAADMTARVGLRRIHCGRPLEAAAAVHDADEGAALGCVTGQRCGIDHRGCAGRHRRFVAVAERAAVAQGRDAQRIIGAARAGPLMEKMRTRVGDSFAAPEFRHAISASCRHDSRSAHIMAAAGRSDQRDENKGATRYQRIHAPCGQMRAILLRLLNDVAPAGRLKECVNHDSDQAPAIRPSGSGTEVGFRPILYSLYLIAESHRSTPDALRPRSRPPHRSRELTPRAVVEMCAEAIAAREKEIGAFVVLDLVAARRRRTIRTGRDAAARPAGRVQGHFRYRRLPDPIRLADLCRLPAAC